MRKQSQNKTYIMKYYVILLCFCLCCILEKKNIYAQTDPLQEAKQGIVEIYSGFTVDDGTFYKMKHASGFVICNQDSNTYVITNGSSLKSSEEEKKSYCKVNNISTENISFEDVFQVVVKGDITVGATILTESKNENYCILQVEKSINEKIPLKLGISEKQKIGDTIYTMGFGENAGGDDEGTNRHTEFSAIDVEINEGKLQDTEANQTGMFYLQHSGVIHEGNSGGPILNAEGYVVGMNDMKFNNEASMVYYSLPIDDIREVLNNFDISYGSIEQDHLIEQLYTEIKKDKEKINDGKYKKNSKRQLQQTIQEIEASLNSGELQSEEVQNIIAQLQEAEGQLQLKMKTSRKLMIVLLIVIVILTAWLVKLALWIRKNKKNNLFLLENEEERTIILDPYASKKRKQKKKTESEITKREAYFRCYRTGQTILLKKEKTYIGKKPDINDMVIADNLAISRNHAYILNKEGEYYIYDCDSANGTTVNGIRIEPKTPMKLKDGMKVSLADELFVFGMEKERGANLYDKREQKNKNNNN